MALQTTFTSNPVKTIIVHQPASTSNSGVGDNNVSGGPVYLVSATINNRTFGTVCYTKLYDAAAATAGTDTATAILSVAASGTKTYSFFPPLYFANGLSVVTTTTAGNAGTTAPGTPPDVTLVLSETAS